MLPASASARTPSAKRTGSRAWRRQYVPLASSPSWTKPPVRLDTTPMRGRTHATFSASRSSGSSTGSSSGEWNACETFSAWPRTPRACSSAITAATAAARPETTVCSGPLTAAMATSASRPRNAPATAASPAKSAAIAPSRGSACMSRPRSATRPSPSSSEHMPATQAATYSPTLWPSTAAGVTPHARHSSASAHSIANSAGCA